MDSVYLSRKLILEHCPPERRHLMAALLDKHERCLRLAYYEALMAKSNQLLDTLLANHDNRSDVHRQLKQWTQAAQLVLHHNPLQESQ